LKRHAVTLFFVALAVRLGTALLILQPGYMDAAYYAAGAVRLARGGGFSEAFIWNYLGEPAGVVHPGFLYWMPLASLLAAPFAALWPDSFLALQAPFAILSAALPLVAYGLTWRTTGRTGLAWTAGLITVFTGFFFPYWTLPETFTPFALTGSLALWLAGVRDAPAGSGWARLGRWMLVGLGVGLAHLTRADGVLLLGVVALAPFMLGRGDGPEHASAGRLRRVARGVPGSLWPVASRLLALIVGYVLVMAPWFARNTAVTGVPLPPATLKTAWLTDYDDLFCYACDLSPSSYLSWGWSNVLRSKLSALWINAQRFLAENCLVFLFPLAAVGFYRLRRLVPFQLALVYLGAIYAAHSLVFTLPGWRGGFFHASSALLPFIVSAAMTGLDAAVNWAADRRRGWRAGSARRFFAIGAVALAVILSGYVGAQKVATWRTADAVYREVDRWLTDEETTADAGVAVGNPPSFWYHTDRAAIAIPNGGVETLLGAADQYDMRYVLLEPDHTAGLADLYAGAMQHPRLRVLRTWSEGRTVLYGVEP
jgi:hypothetical protein